VALIVDLHRWCRITLLAAVAAAVLTRPGLAAEPVPSPGVRSFTIESKVLHETRRINVYTPIETQGPAPARLPVLYMPDGGMAEDFLHVIDTVQTLVNEGAMRPFLVVGIENTERRRDMTGPTEVDEDRKIAPHVGGSAPFRKFIREELMPEIRKRYPVTEETGIVGESLAGLFIVETFLLEPDLFDTYIAIDPSVWWNHERLVQGAADRLKAQPYGHKTLYLTTADEPTILHGTEMLAGTLRAGAPAGLAWFYEPMPKEHHGTIYRAAEAKAYRTVFGKK
jgi:predicted alpha/beta superfamily hydrolase